ncbi:MAG TPA: nuclease-related domain-containing protein [bacterium]|nr:nuclease-related domain-containing protein [bacterium]
MAAQRPPRVAERSLEAQLEDLLGEISFYTLLIVMLLGFVFAEWVRKMWPAPPNPALLGALTAPIVAYGVFCLQRSLRLLRRLRQEQRGARVVAETLEALRMRGAVVLHDIPAPGFTVDHLVLCPQGVYAVQAAAYPPRRGGEIRFQNGFLHAGSRRLTDDPVQQAKAQARWVQAMLAEGTGRTYAVRPVLLFPGWSVQPMPEQPQREVWVLNPKALPVLLEREPERLTEDDLSLAAYHLLRYINVA